MEWILTYCIVGICMACIIYGSARRHKRRRQLLADWMDVTTEASPSTGMDDEVNDIYIAGLHHHCTEWDIGPFIGVVFNEKSNPADRDAMAILDTNKRKIVGYVPAKILDDYRDWCKGKKRYCVGYIFWDGEYLRGRCRVYPSMDEVPEIEKDASRYTSQVADHFGWELNDDGTMKR